MSRSTSRVPSLDDFDVITGPPAPPRAQAPLALQKPADPALSPALSNGPARADTAPGPAQPEPSDGQ